MLIGTSTNTLECLWALRITFCGDNWKKLTGHHFTFEEPRRLPFCYYCNNRMLTGVHRDTKRREIEGPEAGWD